MWEQRLPSAGESVVLIGESFAYDLLSTVAYSHWRKMSRKMAMSIGGEYRADYVRDRHLESMFE